MAACDPKEDTGMELGDGRLLELCQRFKGMDSTNKMLSRNNQCMDFNCAQAIIAPERSMKVTFLVGVQTDMPQSLRKTLRQDSCSNSMPPVPDNQVGFFSHETVNLARQVIPDSNNSVHLPRWCRDTDIKHHQNAS